MDIMGTFATLNSSRFAMPTQHLTPEELESEIGDQLKQLRLFKNLDQKTLAERAGVSVRALRNIEGGEGSTLRTLVCVLRALGRQDWLNTLGPIPTINPLMLTREAQPRQRASRRRQKPQDPTEP